MQARAQTSFSPALVGKRFPHPWPSLDELKEVNRGGYQLVQTAGLLSPGNKLPF